MLPYNLLFALLAVGSLDQRLGRGPLLMGGALILMLMIGLRLEVGADWFGYHLIFENVRYMSFGQAVVTGDPGFYALNWLIHALGLEIWALNLVCSAIFTIGLVRFAQGQPNPLLAIVVALPVLCIIVAMSATRQSTAIGLVLLGLRAFTDGRMLRFLFYTGLATMFHASAILIIPVAALSYTRNRLQAALVIVVGAVLAANLLVAQLEIYVNRYTGEDVGSEGAIFRVGMNFVPALLFLISPRQFATQDHERTLWRNFAFLAIASMALFPFVPSTTALDRAALYIIPLQIFVMSRVPYALAGVAMQRTALTLAVVGYSALVMVVFFLFSTHGEYWLPYRFYPFAEY